MIFTPSKNRTLKGGKKRMSGAREGDFGGKKISFDTYDDVKSKGIIFFDLVPLWIWIFSV